MSRNISGGFYLTADGSLNLNLGQKPKKVTIEKNLDLFLKPKTKPLFLDIHEGLLSNKKKPACLPHFYTRSFFLFFFFWAPFWPAVSGSTHPILNGIRNTDCEALFLRAQFVFGEDTL
jgi:hypothetical protein